MKAQQAIESTKNQNATKNAQEAERLKQERMQHEEMIAMQKKADELKAMSMKQMIRSQKDEQKALRGHGSSYSIQQQRLILIRRIK